MKLLKIIVVLPFECIQGLFSVYDSGIWINSCQNAPTRANKTFVETMTSEAELTPDLYGPG